MTSMVYTDIVTFPRSTARADPAGRLGGGGQPGAGSQFRVPKTENSTDLTHFFWMDQIHFPKKKMGSFMIPPSLALGGMAGLPPPGSASATGWN